MKSLIAGLAFATLAFVLTPAAASADCWGCGYPPGVPNGACMTSLYNGGSACGMVLGSCVPIGSCTGVLGDECATFPHCGPQQKWVSSKPPRRTDWKVASVEVIRLRR